MILWFLRLFPAYDRLETAELSRQSDLENTEKALELAITERDEFERERDRLQIQFNAAEEERGRLWQRLDIAISEERRAYQAHVNAAWQERGHGVPYPDAPSIPLPTPPKQQEGGPVGRQGRMLSSQQMALRRHQFAMQIVQQAKEQAERAG